MKYKKIFEYIIVALIGIVLLNLVTANHLAMEEAVREIDNKRLTQLHAIKMIYGFILGMLLNYSIILKYFEGNIRPNLNLIPGIFLLGISFIPPIYILQQFGIMMPIGIGSPGLNWLLAPLEYSSYIQFILSMIAGILITKGFYKPNNFHYIARRGRFGSDLL